MHNKLHSVYFTYRLLSYTYAMKYSSVLIIIIQDKTTING